MPKQNRKPGIHLHTAEILKPAKKGESKLGFYISNEYYWILISKNGKTIARSSETYKTKRASVKSISIAAKVFSQSAGAIGWNYYDHSAGKFQPDFVVF